MLGWLPRLPAQHDNGQVMRNMLHYLRNKHIWNQYRHRWISLHVQNTLYVGRRSVFVEGSRRLSFMGALFEWYGLIIVRSL